MNLDCLPNRILYLRYSLIITFVITIASIQIHAQFLKYDFVFYDTKEGLSQKSIVCITQDKTGFMWFGTEDGLNRFDGHEFKVFKNKEGDPASLVHNSIRTLLVDDDNSLWVGTSEGLCRYFPETEMFEQFEIDITDVKKINGGSVYQLKKDENGRLWIMYIGSGIDVLENNQVKLHYSIVRDDEPDYKLKSDIVTSLEFMPGGNKLIGHMLGLQVINNAGRVLQEKEATALYPWINYIDSFVRCLLLSKDKNFLWVGTELNGVIRVDLKSNKIKHFTQNNSGLQTNQITVIQEDSHSRIWIGGDAIYHFDHVQQNLVLYKEHGLNNKYTTLSIFEDRDKNLWLGTKRVGVIKYNTQNTNIFHFHSNPGNSTIKSDEVTSFEEDSNGNIWVAWGEAGLFKLRDDLKGFDFANINNKLLSPSIKRIVKDSKYNFWIGCWNGGFAKYNPSNDIVEIFHPDKKNFPSLHVWDFAEDKDGNMWIATLRDGLYRLNPKTKERINYQNDSSNPSSLANNDVLCLYIDSRGILYAGTSHGLSILFPDSDSFENLYSFSKGNAISDNIILNIKEDKEGKIWIGTNGGGITVLKIVGNTIKVEKILKEKDGLPNNIITAIQNDSNNNLWISTFNGLTKINPTDYSFMEIPESITLKGTEFYPQSNFLSSDGRIFFGGINGFHMFHPDSLKYSQKPLKVHLTSLRILNNEISPSAVYDNRNILEKSITWADAISLSYKDYAFSISFSTLTYNGQQSLHYAYFLENLDKDWQYTTADKRFVHYTSLSPGKYQLKLKASYDGVTWPEEYSSLDIFIIPPWYATNWFKAGVAILIALLISLIIKMRFRFLKNQSRKLENLVKLRTAELNKSNQEIQVLLEEVAKQNKNIEKKNKALQEMNEELEAQKDNLEFKGKELERAQLKLQEINANLEQLVKKRTKILNDTLRELGTFLYRASHDLQGPISTMKGLIAVSKMESSPELYGMQYLDSFHLSVHKLETTLQKLLKKYSIQNTRVHYELINKNTLMKLLQKEVLPRIECFRKEDFTVLIDNKLEFKTDKTLLLIIISNLLDNAFAYSKNALNKKVELQVFHEKGNTILSVMDYGQGIKEVYKEKVFSMFFRANERSTGNGLGLYLVKCAAEKLNSSVKLDSVEGEYTRFTVSLNSQESYQPKEAANIITG